VTSIGGTRGTMGLSRRFREKLVIFFGRELHRRLLIVEGFVLLLLKPIDLSRQLGFDERIERFERTMRPKPAEK